jgi:hypothetical protein
MSNYQICSHYEPSTTGFLKKLDWQANEICKHRIINYVSHPNKQKPITVLNILDIL